MLLFILIFTSVSVTTFLLLLFFEKSIYTYPSNYHSIDNVLSKLYIVLVNYQKLSMSLNKNIPLKKKKNIGTRVVEPPPLVDLGWPNNPLNGRGAHFLFFFLLRQLRIVGPPHQLFGFVLPFELAEPPPNC